MVQFWWMNFPGEADIAVAHVEKLVSAGIAPSDIALIAPYNLQVYKIIHFWNL